MRSVLAVTCLVLLLLAPDAQAHGADSAQLLRVCSAAVKWYDGVELSAEELIEAPGCIGYVSGFGDALVISASKASSRQVICFPQRGITNNQGVRIFVKYLRENPKDLHKDGGELLFTALARAFPCH